MFLLNSGLHARIAPNMDHCWQMSSTCKKWFGAYLLIRVFRGIETLIFFALLLDLYVGHSRGMCLRSWLINMSVYTLNSVDYRPTSRL